MIGEKDIMDSAIESLEATITSELEACDREVAGIASAWQAHAKSNAEPGTYVPNYGKFDLPGEQAKGEASVAVHSHYAKAKAALDGFMDARGKELSKSASADDVASVRLTLDREHVSQQELAALWNRHKGNAQLAGAIRDRGIREGFYIGEPVAEFDYDAADKMLSRSFSVYGRYAGTVCPAGITAKSVVENLTQRFKVGF